jgi:hypothetical protein
MDARDGAFEVAQDRLEWGNQRGAPRHNYIVKPLASRPRHDVIGRRPQSPANTIALYRGA